MSTHLGVDGRPTFSIIDRLPFPGLRCANEFEEVPSATAAFGEDPLCLYLDGVSTRGVEVWQDGERFIVRLPALACPEDHVLAHEIIQRAAQQLGVVPLDADEDEPLPTGDELDAWVEAVLTTEVVTLRSVLRTPNEDGSPVDRVHIEGPLRVVALGQATAALLDEGPEAEWAERLFALIRRVQYIDEERYYEAQAVQVTYGDGDETVLSIWNPDVGYLFGDVPELLIGGADQQIIIPKEALGELVPNQLTWLDEDHVLVEPISTADWPDLVARALAY